jgi:hypothetical protein
MALVRAGMGDHESGLRALTTLAELDRDSGDLSSAELLLEEAVEGVAPEDRTDAWRQAAAALARLLVERGALERAHALLDEAEHPPSDGVRTKVALARGRRAVLTAEGRPDEGEAILTALIEALGPSRLAFVPTGGSGDRRPATRSVAP